ncbi:MAG TPA: hypothetical protein VMM55_13000 [Thermohalobaculum sp.]|nr:hypothetical protein [Thermohalobaculum sp.]
MPGAHFDASAGIPNCPALYRGERLLLSPPLGQVSFRNPAEPPPALAAAAALRTVSFFENAGSLQHGVSAYDAIGALDDLSLGRLQWNWKGGRGTLVTEFFAGLEPAVLAATRDADLASELMMLVRFSRGQAHVDDAGAVIAKWRAYIDRPSSVLADWLASVEVAAYQDVLIARRLEQAAILAETWMSERGYPPQTYPVVLALFTNFNVHTGLSANAGSLRGVWTPQLDRFLSSLGHDSERIMGFILDWMRSCEDANVTKKTDAFGAGAGVPGNVDIWSAPDFISSLSGMQVDLMAYVFLYATRSDTQWADFPKGYSQLDVLQRGGVIALGQGRALGVRFDWKEFLSPH